MAQQPPQQQPQPTGPAGGSSNLKKKPKKIFGVMTKRRWFGVLVFLTIMLWSYTAGPPLEDSVICNRYFLDGRAYDYSTIAFEGDIHLIDEIFKRGFWPDVFTWQIGAYFDWTEGPLWSEKYAKLLFTDTIQNKLFSWSPINGIQIESENAGECTEKQINKLHEPGSNGLLQHPFNEDVIIMTQHAQRRIIKYDLIQKNTSVIIGKYKGKQLNSPNDLVLGPKSKYIYFTDPPYGLVESEKLNRLDDPNHEFVDKQSKIGFNGIYRVKLDGKNDIELLDKSMKRPNGIAFSNDFSKLFVSNCIQGTFEMNVFNVNKNDGTINLSETWNEESLFKNVKDLATPISGLKGGLGCSDGLKIVSDLHMISTCPGGKLCIIDIESGDLKAVVKMADNTRLSNVAIGKDRNLYVTGNYSVWQIRLQPDQ